MKKIHFAGLWNQISKKHILHLNTEFEVFDPLAMDLIFPIFLVYIAVIVLSLFMLLFEYFTSDLILIITDDNNNDDLYIAKEFNKYSNKKMQGFIGGIDINKNFDQFAWKLITSPYHDIIVVSYGGTKLIKKLTEIVSETCSQFFF